MIVVTGGAGFIGSNLVAGLEARGERNIVVCDRLGNGDKWRNIAKRGLAGVIAPENLLAYLDGAGPDIRAVFHMGAISATTETDVDLIMDNNFRLSTDVWAVCARHGVPLIYASSAATYGDGGAGFDDDMSQAAQASLRPLNPYGWSKHLFDRWVAQRLEDGVAAPPQWAGLKFFNVYGPNEYHKEGQISVALKNYREVAAGGPAVLFKSHNPDYADGGQLRDFVWVGDCVAVMLWLLDNQGVSGLFNLGAGKAESFADLAAALFGALGKPVDIRYVDTPEAIRDKYQYFTEARMDRLRGAGFEAPFTALEDGVRQPGHR
ncbi:MAG: ADP-glyceromanno-heptose 6-epimerase [Alphaproteobacteria bacterium]